MKNIIRVAKELEQFNSIAEELNSPLVTLAHSWRLEDGVVFHLVKYEEGEEKPGSADSMIERQLTDVAAPIVQVKPLEAEKYFNEGYKYTNKWKDLVELTLYKKKKEPVDIETGKDMYYVDMNSFHIYADNEDEARAKAIAYVDSDEYTPIIDAVCLWKEELKEEKPDAE